jgi:ribosomal protein S10
LKIIIDLKSTDGKLFEQTLGKLQNLAKRKGIQLKRMPLPTKYFQVPSGYEVRIRRAIITIVNPQEKEITEIKETLRPISENLAIEVKALKNALALEGKEVSERELKEKLCSKIEVQKGY